MRVPLIANLLAIAANRAGIVISSQISSHLLFGFIADLHLTRAGSGPLTRCKNDNGSHGVERERFFGAHDDHVLRHPRQHQTPRAYLYGAVDEREKR
jgi:hypothetical protein